MKRTLFFFAFAFLFLLPGCLSESIKTKEECASLAPPPSGANWAGTDISEYKDAYAYEQVSCWHEAAIWYAIKGDGYEAVESCNNIYSVDWSYASWLEEEHNVCITDIAEKLKDPAICSHIQDIESNAYMRSRCISRAEKAASTGSPLCSGAAFILAGLGAFLFCRKTPR
ncbi:MAG: hypothetical protein QXH30_01540 [Candidatus Bilamarchaeaceae archaeon]